MQYKNKQKMPKEIKDIKKFLTIAKGTEKESKDQKESDKKKVPPPHKKTLYIKYGKKITKFKLRGKQYLYTFQTVDKEKAAKLLQSLPQNMNRVEIKSKKVAAKKKKK